MLPVIAGGEQVPCFCEDDQKTPGGSNSRALGTHSSCFWWRVLTENSQEMISVPWHRRFTSNVIIDKTQLSKLLWALRFYIIFTFFCDFLCFRKPASSKKPSTKGASSKRTSGKDSESSKKSRESEKSRKSEKGSSLRFVQTPSDIEWLKFVTSILLLFMHQIYTEWVVTTSCQRLMYSSFDRNRPEMDMSVESCPPPVLEWVSC